METLKKKLEEYHKKLDHEKSTKETMDQKQKTALENLDAVKSRYEEMNKEKENYENMSDEQQEKVKLALLNVNNCKKELFDVKTKENEIKAKIKLIDTDIKILIREYKGLEDK